MQNKLLILFFVLLWHTSLATGFPTRCECGTFETGITMFYVNGAECCSSAVLGASFYTYEEEAPGVWTMIGNDPLPGAQAQGTCCDFGH